MINLTRNCGIGSSAWQDRVKKVKEERPENFIFGTDVFGENTLEDLLDGFQDKETVREEVITKLEHYARFDMASIYKLLKDNGFQTVEQPDEEEQKNVQEAVYREQVEKVRKQTAPKMRHKI